MITSVNISSAQLNKRPVPFIGNNGIGSMIVGTDFIVGPVQNNGGNGIAIMEIETNFVIR